MPRTLPNRCVRAAACVGLALAALSAQAQPDANPLVLILNSYDESTAPYARVRTVFMRELPRHLQTPIAFRQFDLDERDAEGPADHQLTARLLRERYTRAELRLVVALGPPAIDFWLAHRDSVAAEAPLLAMAGKVYTDGADLRPGDAVVATDVSLIPHVENLLKLLPETRQLLVVFGSSGHERRLAESAKHELEPRFGTIALEYVNDLTVGELERRLTGLPAGSAVLYGLYDSDVHGVVLDSDSALALIRKASAAPVFGVFDSQLGRGIVGGRLVQLEQIGREAAVTAVELLTGGAALEPRKLVELGAPLYDWRELRTWHIDPDRLPPGSTLKFRPPVFWEEYFGWVLGALFVIAAQALLVGVLLLQRRRRRQAEFESDSLGSRLISAHEDERRRIARELHDDLSQRLARLSIDVGFIGTNPGTEAAREVLQVVQPELVRIGADIHDMSYRLHPSLVEDLGLVAALKAECERVRRQGRSTIVERIDDLRERIPPDLGLCLYRIAQEALHNAVRHANADAIEVAFEKDGRALLLAVRDDGVGFDAARPSRGSGLGLSSMRERARLVGGQLKVSSRPGHGTTVALTVPWRTVTG